MERILAYARQVQEAPQGEDLTSHLLAVDAFCNRYGVKLLAVELEQELDRREMFYAFDDNTGRYSLQGILSSLSD
jgi:hypothetical protein